MRADTPFAADAMRAYWCPMPDDFGRIIRAKRAIKSACDEIERLQKLLVQIDAATWHAGWDDSARVQAITRLLTGELESA